ncbi:MAG: hypothetical protein ACAH27_05755 [Xanthobacteraceae bacterium]
MADPFNDLRPTTSSFGRFARIVSPGPTDLDPVAKAVICLTAGDITIVPDGNDNAVTVAFVGVSAGFIPPYRVRRVTAATATVATIDG